MEPEIIAMEPEIIAALILGLESKKLEIPSWVQCPRATMVERGLARDVSPLDVALTPMGKKWAQRFLRACRAEEAKTDAECLAIAEKEMRRRR